MLPQLAVQWIRLLQHCDLALFVVSRFFEAADKRVRDEIIQHLIQRAPALGPNDPKLALTEAEATMDLLRDVVRALNPVVYSFQTTSQPAPAEERTYRGAAAALVCFGIRDHLPQLVADLGHITTAVYQGASTVDLDHDPPIGASTDQRLQKMFWRLGGFAAYVQLLDERRNHTSFTWLAGRCLLERGVPEEPSLCQLLDSANLHHWDVASDPLKERPNLQQGTSLRPYSSVQHWFVKMRGCVGYLDTLAQAAKTPLQIEHYERMRGWVNQQLDALEAP